MKSTLQKFYYKPKAGSAYNDNSLEIHIAGDSRNYLETLCGSVDTGQEQIKTDKMPTCESCLSTYNMIKNGKLRK